MSSTSSKRSGVGWSLVKGLSRLSKHNPTHARRPRKFPEPAEQNLTEPSAKAGRAEVAKKFYRTSPGDVSPVSSAGVGGGLFVDPNTNRRPRYWGHRERLRERFLAQDHKAMPEDELLELLLFNAIARSDVKLMANRLLAAFGDLNGVVTAPEEKLLQVEGTTPKIYLQLRLAKAFSYRASQARVLHHEAV